MFRVEWLQSALNELAAIWLKADSSTRDAVTVAARQIDRQLAARPEQQGESRTGGRRILFVYPLAVVFRVDAQRRTVSVLNVWRFVRRPRSAP